jgi:hypothetical protein
MRSPERLRILFLAANPLATSRLDLEEELRSLEGELRSVLHRDRIDLISAHAVRPDDVVRLLRREAPAVVHFSGHGSQEGIMLRGDQSDLEVPGSALARVFRDRGIKLVVLNACFSDSQAEALEGAVPVVVGTTASLDDEAARRFSTAFYRTIGDGYAISEAFRDGRDVVDVSKLEDVFRLRGEASLILCGWSAHDRVAQRSDSEVNSETIGSKITGPQDGRDLASYETPLPSSGATSAKQVSPLGWAWRFGGVILQRIKPALVPTILASVFIMAGGMMMRQFLNSPEKLEERCRSSPRYTLLPLEAYANGPFDWLAQRPVGNVSYAGIPFTLGAGDRAVVHLSSIDNPYKPAKVAISIVDKQACVAHILINGSWTESQTVVGSIVFRYNDQSEKRVPLVAGETIGETWMPSNALFNKQPPTGQLGARWHVVVEDQQVRGDKPAKGFIGLLAVDLDPARKLHSFEIETAGNVSGVFLAGLTLQGP